MEEQKILTIGGQAVIEGVMMRSPDKIAIAVRKPNGDICVKSQPFVSIAKKVKVLGLPLIRGGVTLIESMIMGVKALTFSGDIAMVEEEEAPKEKTFWDNMWMVVTVIISFTLGLGLFFYVPLLLTGLFHLESGFMFNLVDGIIRMAIFLAYIYFITMWKDIRRVFEYHGAEHKTVSAFEDKKGFSVEEARSYSTLHPRCGTSFLLIVMVVSIFVFMFLGKPETIGDRLVRLAFIPVIGGISYEFIRLSGKGYKYKFVRMLIQPGLWLQKLTTKEPDDDQLEVALVAMKTALGEDPSLGISKVEVIS